MCAYNSKFDVGASAAVIFANNSAPVGGNGGGFFGQSTVVTVASGATLEFVGNQVLFVS